MESGPISPKSKRSIVPPGVRIEAEMLLALGAVAATLFAFFEIADLVSDGRFHALDEKLMLLLRDPADPSAPLGPSWLQGVVRDITALGSSAVLSFVVLSVAGYLAITERTRSALLVIVLSGSGMALANLAKLGFERPRPDLVPHAVEVTSLSFPSQHALMAAVVYLTLGVLVARTQRSRRVRIYVMSLAIALMALVGVTRVWLGVHWPSDVLAGWMLGAAWAAICLIIARLVARRAPEPD